MMSTENVLATGMQVSMAPMPELLFPAVSVSTATRSPCPEVAPDLRAPPDSRARAARRRSAATINDEASSFRILSLLFLAGPVGACDVGRYPANAPRGREPG